jgi:O-methyltransferase involved in polyketide biosynthesis
VQAVTDISRVIALAIHALRRIQSVRKSAEAQAWLRYGDQAEGQLLGQTRSLERCLLPALRLAPLRRLLIAALDRRVPGTSQHLLWRKLWFHQRCCEFLRTQGQIVCLGAGLDPLGLRVAQQFPGASILEIDRPDIMRLKRDWLSSAHPQITNLRFLGADLARPKFDPSSMHLSPTERTLVLAEGLFMYLPQSAVEGMIRGLAQWFSAPLEVAFSCLDTHSLRDPTSSIAKLASQLEKRDTSERFRWALDQESAPKWLHNLGFQHGSCTDSDPAIEASYGEFVVTGSQQVAHAHTM